MARPKVKLAATAVLPAAMIVGALAWAQAPGGPERLPAAASSSRPASEVSLAASRATARGTYGVGTYRNSAGRICVVHGYVGQDGRLLGASGSSVEADSQGNCTFVLRPVAVQVINVGSGSSARNERELLVVGLADSSVDSITVVSGGASDAVRPGRDGAFLARIAGVADGRSLSLRVTAHGEEVTIPLPAVPDNDAILRAAEQQYRQGGGTHP